MEKTASTYEPQTMLKLVKRCLLSSQAIFLLDKYTYKY
jgi:hypothetical protein